jgi:hypothetical protein
VTVVKVTTKLADAIAREFLAVPGTVDDRHDAFLRVAAHFNDLAATTPRDRVALWYRRQKNKAFLDRFSRLDVREQTNIYLRYLAGEDVEHLLPPLNSGGHPTTTDGGQEGPHDQTAHPDPRRLD